MDNNKQQIFMSGRQTGKTTRIVTDRLLAIVTAAINEEKTEWTGDHRKAAHRALDDVKQKIEAQIRAGMHDYTRPAGGPCPGCLPAMNPPPAPGETCPACDDCPAPAR